MKVRLLRSTLRVLSRFDLPFIHRLGAGLGRALWLVPNRLRTVTEVNLALCYPRQPAAERRALARGSLIETGKSLTELAALWHWAPERLDALVREVEGWEHVERALAAGRGMLVVTPHIGCWELVGLYFSRRMDLTVMYRPPREAALGPLMVAARERAGARAAATDARGVRALYRALAAGNVIGMLPDQEPRHGAGVFAPFLGMEAYTMALLGRLARKSRAPAVNVLMERLPAGRGFRLLVEPYPEGLYSADERESALAINQAVERLIRIAPAQYMWNYKRLRRVPDGGKRRYGRRKRRRAATG